MPGFMVNGIGGNGRFAKATERYYYTYTWEFDNILGDNDQILINAKDMTLPTFNTSKETVIGASLEYKFAKTVNWEDVKIVWYDCVGMLAILKKWKESVWTPDTGLQPASNYKRESTVSYYPPDKEDGDDKDDVKYKLINSWPSLIRHGELTYTTSDVKIIEVSLTYDWAVEINGSGD